jgi:hypothetical protein
MVGTRSRAIRRGTSRTNAMSLYTHERPSEKPETSFENVPRRIARERVPTIAVLTQHGAAQNRTTADKGDRSRNGFQGDRSRNGFPRIRNRRGAFTAV